jgi:hypothetical protein
MDCADVVWNYVSQYVSTAQRPPLRLEVTETTAIRGGVARARAVVDGQATGSR